MFSLSTRHILDTAYNGGAYNVYKDIVTVSTDNPPGILQTLTMRINPPKLSPFKAWDAPRNNCSTGLKSFNNPHELMTTCEIPELLIYLSNNNYTINTTLTQMLNQNNSIQGLQGNSIQGNSIICFVTL